MEAIRDVHPIWTKAYKISKNSEVESEALSYRTVANDLRKLVTKSKVSLRSAKAQKGAFGPTFAETDKHVDKAVEADDRSDKTRTRHDHLSSSERPQKRTPP